MGFWFNKKEPLEKHVKSYTPSLTEDNMNQIAFSKKFQMELYEDHKVLNNLYDMLFTMIMECRKRKSKRLVVSEEDLQLLFDIARKNVQLK